MLIYGGGAYNRNFMVVKNSQKYGILQCMFKRKLIVKKCIRGLACVS